ncbi:hypothetical protein F2Q68_00026274 [Brassica cretica]|uniref:Uncharacterized protein n=1 Tax=Brassica cretica TaxID=69181 RepID=A0A8S9I9W0_BRACR|nr:hypothetical protein F2Q68_00026274 [Brassica cretica]
MFSTQLRSSSKKNQIKRSSYVTVMRFTNQVIFSSREFRPPEKLEMANLLSDEPTTNSIMPKIYKSQFQIDAQAVPTPLNSFTNKDTYCINRSTHLLKLKSVLIQKEEEETAAAAVRAFATGIALLSVFLSKSEMKSNLQTCQANDLDHWKCLFLA